MLLSEEQARRYEAVKVAVLDWVRLSSEKYRQKLWSARELGERLQPQVFAQSLMDWVTHWLRSSTQTVRGLWTHWS